MKSKALFFCLFVFVTIGVFTACKKTTDVTPPPVEPAKPELSSKDPQALSASLKVYHGEHLPGGPPAPSGTTLTLDAGVEIPDHVDPPFLFMSTHHSWHGDPPS